MHLLLRAGGGAGGARACVSLARMRCASPGLRPPLLLARGIGSTGGSSGSGAPLATSAATNPTTSSTSNPNPSPPSSPQGQFCRHCGASPMLTLVPEGDTHPRQVCPSPACGAVEYRNPRMVVGCIVARPTSPQEVLLCRRAIEPARGRWTLPAGYLEVGESTAQGAQREAFEETGADVEVLRPYAHFDVPAIGQAYLLFLARLRPGGRGPARATAESLETRWFRVDGAEGEEGGKGGGEGGAAEGATVEGVPWSELAFSSVSTALRLYAEDVARVVAAAEGQEEEGAQQPSAAAAAFPSPRHFRQHHGVIERQPGAGPNEAGTYRLREHTWSGGGEGG